MHSVSSYIQNEHAQTGCGGSGALQGLLNVFVHVISGVRAQAADDQIKAARFYLTGWGPVPIPPSLGKQASLKSLIFWGEIAAVLNMQPDSELWFRPASYSFPRCVTLDRVTLHMCHHFIKAHDFCSVCVWIYVSVSAQFQHPLKVQNE